MPAPTERARRFWGAVRSFKEGRGGGSPQVRKAVRGTTYQQVRDFTRKPSRGKRKGRR